MVKTLDRTLNEQADKILEMAQSLGLQENYFFRTTFERYRTQIDILDELRREIEISDILVEKEYVKNRGNIYTHPAITEFNRTTDSANKTVTTLMKILKGFEASKGSSGADPLLKIINGEDDD